MPECQHYEELISAYLDGELSAHEAEELTVHLASCPKCAALLDTYKLLFGKTPVVKAPAGFAASVMGMTAAVQPPRRAKKRAPIIRLVAAAAACLLLVGAAVPLFGGALMGKAERADNAAQFESEAVMYSTTADSADSKVFAGTPLTDTVEAVSETCAEPEVECAAGKSPTPGATVPDASATASNEEGRRFEEEEAGATAILVLEDDADDAGSIMTNAVYIHGELPECCRGLEFEELTGSDGAAFYAEIDNLLAQELIYLGYEHDEGAIDILVWYPN